MLAGIWIEELAQRLQQLKTQVGQPARSDRTSAGTADAPTNDD